MQLNWLIERVRVFNTVTRGRSIVRNSDKRLGIFIYLSYYAYRAEWTYSDADKSGKKSVHITCTLCVSSF